MAGNRVPNDVLVEQLLSMVTPGNAGYDAGMSVFFRNWLHDLVVTVRSAYGSLVLETPLPEFQLDGVTPTKLTDYDRPGPLTQEFAADPAAGEIRCVQPLVVFSLARINFKVEKNKVITPILFADGVDSNWSGTTGVGAGNKPSSAIAIGMFDVGDEPVTLDLRLDSQDPGVDVEVVSVLWVNFTFALINPPDGPARQFFNSE